MLIVFAQHAGKKGLRITSGKLLTEEDATVYADILVTLWRYLSGYAQS